MKAMCTGTTFCERHEMKAIARQKTAGRSPMCRPSQSTSLPMRPVLAIATAKVPRRMYESAVVALALKPSARRFIDSLMPMPPARPAARAASSSEKSTFTRARHSAQSRTTERMIGLVRMPTVVAQMPLGGRRIIQTKR